MSERPVQDPVAPEQLPSVDRLLRLEPVADLAAGAGRTLVREAARGHLEALRRSAVGGTLEPATLEPAALAAAVVGRVSAATRPRLHALFNLTGTVLHTNFGRAPLPEVAVAAVVTAMRSPVNLEFELDTGRRGERDAAAGRMLAELTGAEAATVVNNNAAALVLVLHALAARREVLVSRGELIEIGGSFRLPDIMRAAGARLVEVGTTNRTHLADYEAAIGPRTALLLRVHPSNYVIRGFTAGVAAAELAALAQGRGVPLVIDLGSGALIDLRRYGLPAEPVVRDAVASGADLVTFSGDKLLGGPQAGLVVGRLELIRRLDRDPLKRALRVGKMTVAALEAVLGLYRAPEYLAERLTTLRLLTRPLASIREQAARLAPPVAALLGRGYRVTSEPLASQIGSGAQPGETLPSAGLAVRRAVGTRSASIERLAQRLRALDRPVLGRVADDALWLDLRCLDEGDEAALVAELGRLHA